MPGQRLDERGLAVIDVPGGADDVHTDIVCSGENGQPAPDVLRRDRRKACRRGHPALHSEVNVHP